MPTRRRASRRRGWRPAPRCGRRRSPVPGGDVLGAGAGRLRADLAIAVMSPGRSRRRGARHDGGHACRVRAHRLFRQGADRDSGYGQYSSDLLTLVNPDQFSRFLPVCGCRTASGRASATWVSADCSRLRSPRSHSRAAAVIPAGTWAVIVACVLMGVYALSCVMTFAGSTWRPTRISTGSRPDRALPRVRPVHLVVPLSRAARRHLGRDAAPAGISPHRRPAAGARCRPSGRRPHGGFLVGGGRSSSQVRLRASARRRALPAPGALSRCRCAASAAPYEENYVYRYMLLAYRLKTTYNSGYFARLPADRSRQCARLDQRSRPERSIPRRSTSCRRGTWRLFQPRAPRAAG